MKKHLRCAKIKQIDCKKNVNNCILCLFSCMNYYPLTCLSFLLLLSACHHGPGHAHKMAELTEDSSLQASSVTAAPPDTSLISLKTFGTLSLEDVISQLWEFEDADRPHWNKIFWDSVTDTRQFPEMALFPDHSAIKNPRINLQMGKWTLDKDSRQLRLQWAHGPAEVYIVRQVALKQMELNGVNTAETPAILTMSSQAIIHRRVAEDPYYPSNNQWRVKPARSETPDQIRQRVKACVHFYSLFFLDNHRRQEKDISFSGLPSCFEWYNGSISLQSKGLLDRKWIDCFYSESQALTGYDMLANELEKHELKWPEHPTSWVEQTGQVLDQLYNKL